MGALTFDKKELGNLEYSLTREMLATDRRGGYMSTTIVCCNTRKYHGLIVAPIDDSERDFVLLSSLDESIIIDGQRFNLALHRYRGVYEPRGHKYITDFEYTPTPTITYRVGSVVLRKELLWIHKRTQLMVRYTIVEGDAESVTLQLRPFLAFRDRHALSKSNIEADGRSYVIPGGVRCKLYEGFPWLNMQVSVDAFEFVAAPDWYKDFEYTEELARGYEGHEDLLTPGYFEMELKAGESVIFSASTSEMVSSDDIESDFKSSIERRTHKVDFMSCMQHSARQFLARNADGEARIIAGYPWYGVVGRDWMLSLPGLTLEQGNKEDCIDLVNSIRRSYLAGTLHESMKPENAVDAPLWFFRTLQLLEAEVGEKYIWEVFGQPMMYLLDDFRYGRVAGVSMHDNGLIWAWSDNKAITWMDLTADSSNQQQRNGYQVEVNALWYNAVCYILKLATKFKEKEWVKSWEWVPERAKESFSSLFYLNEGWLADYVNYDTKCVSIRSNMIVACALPYKIVNEQQQTSIITTVKQHLLTPKGLRSLSPRNPLYGMGTGPMAHATKNGSVWVWPLALYVHACFDLMGESFLSEAEAILNNFKENIQFYGIGSIAEYFDADPPYNPHGAISHATSVAGVLEIAYIIKKYGGKISSEAKPAAAPKAKRVTKPKATTAKAKTTKAKA